MRLRDQTMRWTVRLVHGLCLLCFSLRVGGAFAQAPRVEPRIITPANVEGKVTVVEVAARFVTTIRLPDTVNSVVVGDPSEFQVEHSEREPKLVFVKAIATKPSETNLLISMASGDTVCLLLVNRGETGSPDPAPIDFLVRYKPARGFFVAPSGFPSALVGKTVPGTHAKQASESKMRESSTAGDSRAIQSDSPGSAVPKSGLDKLLEQQEMAPLPALYGEQVRAGVSHVMDGGQGVVVLFSVVNPTKRAILLMPPQVQLGGRTTSGKLIRHKRWTTSEQLPVLEFRLSRRRLGPGDRADGVVLFERPPYKQSNETLLLQVAEAGAVDRPALAPIGFGVSSPREKQNGN